MTAAMGYRRSLEVYFSSDIEELREIPGKTLGIECDQAAIDADISRNRGPAYSKFNVLAHVASRTTGDVSLSRSAPAVSILGKPKVPVVCHQGDIFPWRRR